MPDPREQAQALKDKLDRTRQASAGEQMRVTRLHAPGVDVAVLASRLASFYESKKLECQIIDGGMSRTVQARSAGWRKALGMATAITVVLRPDGEDLAVEIGRAKWADKAAAGAAGMLVLWPLMVTAAAGAFREGQLPKETLRFIGACLERSSPREPPSPPPPPPPPAPGAGGPRPGDPLASRQPPSAPPAPPQPPPARLDVNVATAEQLASLPGLDRLSASRIVQERERRGGFADIGELAHATRLPPHVIANLGESLSFGGASSTAGGRRIW